MYSEMEIVEERDGVGSVEDRYYDWGEQRIGGADAGDYFYVKDHLGSIRELTDNTAAIRARYDFDAWGKRNKMAGDSQTKKGYTGHWEHESGLVLAPFRPYDAELGRWLNEDPIQEAGGINLYAYCENNSINDVDPLGLSSCESKYNACMNRCMSKPCPWEDRDSSEAANKNARYRFCEERCQKAYMRCLAKEKQCEKSSPRREGVNPWLKGAAVVGTGILVGVAVACPFEGPVLDVAAASAFAGVCAW